MALIQMFKTKSSIGMVRPTDEILRHTDIGSPSIDLPDIRIQKRDRSTIEQSSSDYDDNPVHDDFDDGKWMHIG